MILAAIIYRFIPLRSANYKEIIGNYQLQLLYYFTLYHVCVILGFMIFSPFRREEFL